MIYGSVCSGIEAASVAWEPLGWRPAFFAEIAPFPRAVLSHHWPSVPLRGDFTAIQAGDHATVDVLVGGTPCQAFSVAGLRGGLADGRGALSLEYCRLVDRLRPRWFVWENVPGSLSVDGGRAFGSILGAMAELGYGFAWRVLDAQHFGVPQRRRRVFVVGHSGGSFERPARVLFEPEGVRRDLAKGRKAGEGVAGTLAASTGGADENDAADGRLIVHTLRAGGHDASEDGTGRGVPLVAQTVTTGTGCRYDPETETLIPVALSPQSGGDMRGLDLLPTAQLQAYQAPGVLAGPAVRRLTPRECERLQGFPDDHTLVPYRKGLAKDAPRYHAIGNSMAVPVMRWLGRRIAAEDAA